MPRFFYLIPFGYFIRFFTFQDRLRQLSQEATGQHPYTQELEEVVQAYRALLCWRRARLRAVPDRRGILYCCWVYNPIRNIHRYQHTCYRPRRYRRYKKIAGGPQYWKRENWENKYRKTEVIPKGFCQGPLYNLYLYRRIG